jgi:hypothetical protein
VKKEIVASIPCAKALDIWEALNTLVGKNNGSIPIDDVHAVAQRLHWMISEGYDVAERERMVADMVVRRGR